MFKKRIPFWNPYCSCVSVVCTVKWIEPIILVSPLEFFSVNEIVYDLPLDNPLIVALLPQFND